MRQSRKMAAAAASLAVFASSLTMTAATAFAADAVTGDFNNDGVFTLTDITAMLNAYVNNKTIDSRTLNAVDVNKDGKVDLKDLTQLLKIYVNGGTVSSGEIDWSKILYADELDFTYQNTKDGVEITGYTGQETVLKVPETINGKPVVKLGIGRGKDSPNITDIKIPSSVTALTGVRGFTQLKSVVLPEGLKEIWNNAFDGCTGLKRLDIPDGIKSVGMGPHSHSNSIFDGEVVYKGKTYDKDNQWILCDTINYAEGDGYDIVEFWGQIYLNGVSRVLTTVVIPTNINEFDVEKFDDCTELTNLVIHEGVISMYASGNRYSDAFRRTKLTSLTLPDSLKFIELKAICYYESGEWKSVFETITWKGKTYKPNQYERLCQDVCNQ